MSSLRGDARVATIARGESALRSGSRGDGVRAIQGALLHLGFDVGSAGADGIYGRDTTAAVKRFQQAHGRSPSGEVDRETLLLLDTALDTAPAVATPPSLPDDYLLKSIGDLRVLDARAEPAAQSRDVRTVHPREVDADIIVSGTFHTGRDPVGPLVQEGRWVTPGAWPHGRGGVAVLADGSVRIGFYPEPSEAAVRAAFERPGTPLREFMGGGALIVEEGAAVSSADLEGRQRFRGGVDAAQFEATARHTMIAVHADGQPYLIIDVGRKPLAAMQEDLVAAGFREAIMFDGGNAFGYEDAEGTLFGRVVERQRAGLSNGEVAALRGQHDVALTGFAIKTR